MLKFMNFCVFCSELHNLFGLVVMSSVSMELSDENMSDSDDDMISCHICLLKFNTGSRKPKYLDCHHYFCFTCIQAFSKNDSISCPTCRNLTNMTGRQLEGLATNNIVLHMMTKAMARSRTYEEGEKMNLVTQNKTAITALNSLTQCKKLWCTQCAVLSTAICRKQQHEMRDLAKVLNETSAVVESQINECWVMWDKAIKDRQRVHQYYDDILSSLQLVQSDIMSRMEINNSNVALMESRKQVVDDLRFPACFEDTENGIAFTMAKAKNMRKQLDGWREDGNHCQFASRQLLDTIMTMDKNLFDISFVNDNPDKRSLHSVDLLKQLQHSFNGASHLEPVVKACVSVLSLVISEVAEDQPKQTNGIRSQKPAAREENKITKKLDGGSIKQLSVEMGHQTSNGRAARSHNSSATTKVPAKHSTETTAIRDSLLRLPIVRTTNEWQTVTKSSGKGDNIKNTFFFRMSINGVSTERVVIQLERKRAPIMCGKFVDIFTKENGFRRLQIFKVVKGEAVFCGQRSFHSHTFEDRSDVFVADESDLAEQRGSLLFHIKKYENGITRVSTEFNVVLKNRPRHHRLTSIFARIIEGINEFDKISTMDPKMNNIIFTDCGVC
ncbi:Uncharacterized protein APZ42_022876 [Daphnia magna]|uniref:Uncharacterized protein n=1 Tax=Daphnia magna TaxID=35525 RepID=A0A0P5CQB3_9CRUS|nr:Uncharacterized protein APZ42_022876 [Daphnia magna]